MVQALLLKNNTVVIAKVEEVLGEIGEPDCKLIKPYILNQSSHELEKWLTYTDQDVILIRSDDVLTFVEPSKEIVDRYLSFT